MSINHSLKSKSIVGVCHISEQYCHHVVVYDISLVSRGSKQHGFGVFRIKSNNIAEYKGISFETPRYLSFYRDTFYIYLKTQIIKLQKYPSLDQ